MARRVVSIIKGLVRASFHGLLIPPLLLSACGLSGAQQLSFRVDERLEFTSPPDRALVEPPVTIKWKIRDFTIAAPGSAPPRPDAGYFAVFVDRAPVPPGETMDAVARDDPLCRRLPNCPNESYLAEQQIYTTTETEIELPQIADLAYNEDIQLHSVTVVLIDTSGRRIGESAWQLELRVRRLGSV